MSAKQCPHRDPSRAHSRGRGQYQCKICHKYFTLNEQPNFHQEDNYQTGERVISTQVPRIMTDKDLLKFLQVDETQWELTRTEYGTHEGFRKDRQVEWHVRNGEVIQGDVHDTGKVLIATMFSVKVYLQKKTNEIASRMIVHELSVKAQSFAPKYPKIQYKKLIDPVLYEIQLPDLQLGRMVLATEAGASLTPAIALEAARHSLTDLINYAQFFPVEKIVFPVGHDFFDANTADNMTAHGTPQRDDPRWQMTFKQGGTFLVEMIEQMSAVAPVDVPIIVGNHDEERMFYMGEVLSAWFAKHPSVKVDNTEKKRKYYRYGKCLIGFTHGYWEKLADLPSIMAAEEPFLWSQSIHREWHVGDKHHMKKQVFSPLQAEDFRGCTVRIIRSLATPSVWEYDKGLIATKKAAESFVWHPERGQIANFNA